MKTAVITVAIGDAYTTLGELTHPSLKAYAKRIGAEFFCITDRMYGEEVPIGYEKFQMLKIFKEHGLDRAIFLDTDIIIRDDAPSLFGFVPEGWIGAFNEGDWIPSRKEQLVDATYVFETSLKGPQAWGDRYYNTGVLVFDREHLNIFTEPEVFHNHFYEQSWLNIQLNRKVRLEFIKNIGIQFNRMSHVEESSSKLDSPLENYFIHYAGTAKSDICSMVARDLASWEEMKKSKYGYHVRRKFKVSVGGGLGDQIDAEPVVREIRRLYPKDHLIVASHWPEIFENLPYEIEEVVNIRTHYNTTDLAHVMHTYADPSQNVWQYMTHVLMSSTDFSSLLAIRRQLPPEKKLIQVRYTEAEASSMKAKLNVTSEWLKDAVLIHPGKSWHTKTLAADVWNEAVQELVDAGLKVVLMGKGEKYDGPKRGSDTIGLTHIICPEGVLDARDKLSVKESLALIDQSKVLVSNDSAPVHLAGATDCWIVGFFTAKHPEFVLPYRRDPLTGEISQRYKVIEVNSRPKCWPCNIDAVTTKPSEVRADHCMNFENKHACHPKAADIVQAIKKL